MAKLESLPAQDSPTGTRDANGRNPTAFDVQKKIEELRDEMEEKARRLPNIIVTGLVEQDPPSSPDDNPPSSQPTSGSKAKPPRSKITDLPSDFAATIGIDPDDLLECRRLGKPQAERNSNQKPKPRPLLLRFQSEQAKRDVLKRRQALFRSEKFSKVYLNDDLTQQERLRRRTLVPVYQQLRRANVKCELRRDKLLKEGKAVSLGEAEALLKQISTQLYE